MKRNWYFFAAPLVGVLILTTQYMIYYWTPLERQLFFSQKIFYYHVPSAFMLFISVFVCGIYSILYLRKRQGRHDDVAVAAGGIAVMFGAIVLITGSIWGRAAWGHWWVWDERLTTSLLLWLVMVSYTLVRKFGGPGAARLSAGLAVFAMVNVPLIYISVQLWDTTHPEANVVPSLTGEMRITFWLSVLLFLVFFIMLLSLRLRQATAERMIHETRELALDAGLFD